MASNTKRGGARPGSGRKNLNRKPVTVMLDVSLLERIALVCKNRSRFINDAVQEKLDVGK